MAMDLPHLHVCSSLSVEKAHPRVCSASVHSISLARGAIPKRAHPLAVAGPANGTSASRPTYATAWLDRIGLHSKGFDPLQIRRTHVLQVEHKDAEAELACKVEPARHMLSCFDSFISVVQASFCADMLAFHVDMMLLSMLNLLGLDHVAVWLGLRSQGLVPQFAGLPGPAASQRYCSSVLLASADFQPNASPVSISPSPPPPSTSSSPASQSAVGTSTASSEPAKSDNSSSESPPVLNRWQEKERIRKMMRDRGIKKEPGMSRIEINGRMHTFLANDRNHPELKEVHKELDRIVKMMYEAGYEPDTRFVLHDIDEEAKRRRINFHSEKLAMCYGFIKTPPKQTIRIMKNLRVCGDCHTATKYMSYITGREIIMRDAFRFHHFRSGVCSCGDYW